jgi:tetratricopeptide (TPR) repeat protein
LRVALSDEARTPLEAVQVAQKAARQRARRQTRQARVLFVTGAVAAVLIVGLAPRLAHRRHDHRASTTAVLPSPISAQPAPPSAAATAEGPIAQAAAVAASETHSAVVTPTGEPPVAGDPKGESTTGDDLGCDVASVRTAAWRLSPSACARAFEADPTNAALALAVAQAEHARGRLTEAAQWARRALTLDPKAAEAYVLIARADMKDGRRDDAGAAYRRYLELAPRGWHHTEARRSLAAR